jgi:hypothetical protein
MRRLQLHHFVVVILASGCLNDTISYSPERDDEAMNAIVHEFSAPGGLTLSLCENVAAPDVDPNDCDVEHTVRGGGRGREHEETRGVGCGGCPSTTVANVKGTISGGGLAAPRMVTGQIGLGGLGDDDPYEFPYHVTLTCEGTTSPCSLSGTLEADGSLQITLNDNAIGGSSTEHALIRGGDASCP